jgi:PAS domain S-box-containing protein
MYAAHSPFYGIIHHLEIFQGVAATEHSRPTARRFRLPRMPLSPLLSPWTGGCLLAIGLLLANAWVANWNTRRVADNGLWVAHTREVLQAIGAVRATVAEAEAGQRGFLVSGESRYVDVFNDAASSAEDQIHRLSTLVVDNPAEAARATELEALVLDRIGSLRHTLSVRAEQGAGPAQRIVASGDGQRIMERIQGLTQTMRHAEDALLSERTAQNDRSLQVKVVTNVLATGVGVAAVLLAFYLFQGALRRRDGARREANLRTRREAALSELRQRALSDLGLTPLMQRAAELVARGLDVPLVKILELSRDHDEFLLRAGVGWKQGAVGTAKVGAGLDSQAGYTLHASVPRTAGDLTTYEPVVVEDFRSEPRFSGPALLHEHGVVSGMSVIVYGQPDRPYGVLGAHTIRPRHFTEEDQDFLQAAANVLAAAIQRRRADVALQESEERFRALADSAPGFVWSSQPDGRADYVNRRWTEATGLPFEQSLGMGWTAMLHPDDVDRAVERWLHSMKTGEPFECEYRFRLKDGTYRWTLGRALPMRNERGEIVKWFGNVTDIEDHKRMEDALMEADRQKDRFLAMLGHELRNPLAPIVNSLELLRHHLDAYPGIQWEVNAIDHQVGHMTRLVDDLLDASRIAHGRIVLKRSVVELGGIVRDAVEMGRPLIEARGHKLDVELPQDTVRLEADPARLVQALGNLLTNAANYTEPGGRIWLHAERVGEEVLIKVRDTGAGISADMLPHVFEMFRRVGDTGQAPGGLGVGLALVEQLVEMHGGRVEAASEGPGRGSEFSIRMPILPAAQAALAAPGSVERALRPCRVLVVDDNEVLAESFARLLDCVGCDVRTAGNGATALDVAREFRPEVVLLDMGLPGMDGYEVASRLRSEPALGKTLVVAVTGYGQAEDVRRARTSGCEHHLVKPVRFDVVERLISEFQAQAG